MRVVCRVPQPTNPSCGLAEYDGALGEQSYWHIKVITHLNTHTTDRMLRAARHFGLAASERDDHVVVKTEVRFISNETLIITKFPKIVMDY